MVKHYTMGEMECMDVMLQLDALKVDFRLIMALKYMWRAKEKGDYFGDLYKAENFIHHARTGEWL